MLWHSGILGVVASLAMLAAPAAARGKFAGGIDMSEACHMQYGNNANAYNDGNSAWGWYCDINGKHYGVDTNTYCAQKYGNAASSDPQGGGKYDWACYYPN
jgi:hypothetical protein